MPTRRTNGESYWPIRIMRCTDEVRNANTLISARTTRSCHGLSKRRSRCPDAGCIPPAAVLLRRRGGAFRLQRTVGVELRPLSLQRPVGICLRALGLQRAVGVELRSLGLQWPVGI